MGEVVDFTNGNTITSIPVTDTGTGNVAGKANQKNFPFSVCLKPKSNVKNGLLDSFHGKSVGIGASES